MGVYSNYSIFVLKQKRAIMRHIESASNSSGGHSNDFLRIGGIILLTLSLSNTTEDFSLDYQMRLCTSTKANENSLNMMYYSI